MAQVKNKNTTHPLKPNYTGPTQGWFVFIHHGVILEYSADILERVSCVKSDKPAHEQVARAKALQVVATKFITKQLQTTRQAWDTARQACDTARQIKNTARQAYDTAEQAYNTARQAYDTAEQAYNTAWQAYNTAEQAYDTAWLIRTFPKTDWKKLWNEKEYTLRYT